MNIVEAKQAIDKVIAKARVHLYKPIQIAEIYTETVHKQILSLNWTTSKHTEMCPKNGVTPFAISF
jgi:HaeII restriction endonuclease